VVGGTAVNRNERVPLIWMHFPTEITGLMKENRKEESGKRRREREEDKEKEWVL